MDTIEQLNEYFRTDYKYWKDISRDELIRHTETLLLHSEYNRELIDANYEYINKLHKERLARV